MKKYYKFIKLENAELNDKGNAYPISAITSFGPPFEGKKDARNWLKENMDDQHSYFLERFFIKHLPKNTVPASLEDETLQNQEE